MWVALIGFTFLAFAATATVILMVLFIKAGYTFRPKRKV